MACAICSIDSLKQRCSLRAAPAFMRNAMVHGLPKKVKLNLLATQVGSCLKRKRQCSTGVVQLRVSAESTARAGRSEERRVGKECRTGCAAGGEKEKGRDE